MIEKNQKSGKKHPLSAFLTVVFFLFALTAAAQTTEVLCNDGIDNDGDGLIDCLDGNCQFAANIESGCNCYDGLDNDGDGKIDQADNNCAPYFGLTFVGENSNCSIVPPGANTPFDLIGPPAVSGQNTADTQSKVAAGDVDGNGVPDAVITSKWNSEVRLIASTTSTGIAAFGAPNFDPGDVIADFRLTGNAITSRFDDIGCGKTKNLLFEHEVLIADIDKNGRAEVFAVVSNRSGNPDSPPSNFFLIGLRLNAYGAQGLQLIPGFPVCLGTNRPGIFGIADMDGDGKAEVYLRDRIFAAENGKLLASEGSKLMSNTALWDVNVTSAPVTVDIKGAGADGNKMELVVGPKIYTVPSLTNRNPAAPGALTLWRDMNTLTFDINGDGAADQYFVKLMTDPIEYGVDTHSATSIADVDKDGHVDVVITGALNSSVGRTTIFYWNVQKNTVSGFRTLTSADLGIAPGTEPGGTCPTGPSYTNYQNGWIWGAGRVNIGDANGDGKLDFSFMAGSHLYCVTTDAPGTNIIPLWATPRTVNDSRSGVLTVTIYDFDNDGNPEMVYRDSQELVVIDGATGTNKYWSAICQSHTYTEGPIIADVNGDGATDICVTCARQNFDVCDGIQQQALGEVRLFFSNGNEWLPTRKVWNQPGYHVVNINDNLTLPFPQLDPALVFSNAPCPNGTPGPQTPLNVFLNQVPFLSADGCPVFPAPDLSFTGDDPDQPGVDTDGDGVVLPAITVIPPICGNLDIKAIFRIINDGDLPISAAVPVSFFIGDPTDPGITSDSLIHTTTLNIVNLQVGATYVSPTVTFNGSGKPFRLYIVLNNNGSVLPINPNGTVSNECRIDNNIYDVFIQPDPFSAVIEKVSDNNKCVAADPNIGELTAHIFKGDPTVPANEVLDFSNYAFQWYYGVGTTNPVPANLGGNNYTISALPEGDYSLVVTNTLKGCTTLPVDTTILLNITLPEVTINVISDQTTCSPPNGVLEAVVTGGNTGFTFEWFNNAAPMGISTATASNLIGSNYTVAVSRNGCVTTATEVVDDMAFEPDVTATSTPVENCANLFSGTVSATASLQGVLQNETEYTFDWYYHNIGDGTRGSILPPVHGTGPNRTGLPAGFYQVEVTRISTQCRSTPFVIEVQSLTKIPTVVISRLGTQTSCDPANPNGRLQATAFIDGMAQDPALFTFEWFEGQNTLPANAHTSVSGVSGSIAEEVKGGGLSYTVRATSTFQCSGTDDEIALENIQYPVVTLIPTPNGICDPAIAGTSYAGGMSVSVDFDGVTVTDFTNYSFTWYDGTVVTATPRAETTSALTGLNTGYYTVVVERTDLGCVAAPENEEVANITVLPTITALATPSTNCVPALANGQINVSNVVSGATSGTGAPFTFQWYTGSVVDPANLMAGETGPLLDQQQGAVGAFFTVKVVNTLDGCSNTDTKEIGDGRVIPLLTMSQTPNGVCDPALTVPAISFNGTATGTVSNSGSYADPTFVYEWIDNATTSVIGGAIGLTATGLNNGFYTTTVTHVPTGCESAPGVIEVLPDKLPITITAVPTPSTNCIPALVNGQMEVTNVVSGVNTGTGAPFRYEWYTGSVADPVNQLAGETTPLLDQQQGAIGAFFTVKVVNLLDGCSNTDTKEIGDARVIPLLSMGQTPNGVCDPALTVPAVSFNGTATGTVSNSASYTDPTFVYEWIDNATTLVIGGATGLTATGLNNGFYTTTVTHVPTGCESAPGVIEVLADKEPIVITALATPSTNCLPALANGEMEVTNVVSGASSGIGAPFRYEWYTGSVADPVNVLAGETTVLLDQQQGAIGAFFTVLVVNTLDGCSNTDTKEITDAHVDPLLNMSQTPNGVCDPALTVPLITYNGTATGTVSNSAVYPVPTFTYVWVDNSTNSVIVGATAATATGLNNGFYTTTVTHVPTGCESAPGVIEVLPDKEPIIITALATPSTNCLPALANGEMEVTNVVSGATSGVGAPFRYEWYTGSVVDPGNVLAGETTSIIDQKQGAIGAFFTVLVVNTADGCSNTDTKEIADRQVKPILTLGSTPNTFCDPALIVPAGAPGSGTASQASYTFVNPDYAGPQTLTYSWFDGQSGVDPDPLASHLPASTTNTIDRLAAGYYTATVTITELGCTSDPYSVEVEDELFLPVLNITDTPQTSCNDLTPNGILVTTGNELTLPASQGGPGGAAITAGYDFSYFMDWNATPNDPSGDPTTGTPVADVTGTASSLAGNKYYAVQVERIATGCVTTEKIFLNENIIVPVVTLGGLVPQSECDTPDGSITATVTTPAVTTTYSYYWLRENAGTTTTDADLIIAAVNGNPADPNNLTTVNSNTHINGGLVYGRYSLVVVDNYNSCTSVPVFEDIDDNTQSDIDITLFGPPPSDCTTDGALQMRAERLFTPPVATSFTFEVFRGSPINPVTPIDYYSTPPNPPAFAGAVLETLIAANNTFINTTVAGISSDLYTVVAEDNFGCKTYESFFLPFADSHDVTFTPTDVTSCVVDNGAITMRAVFPTTGLGISNNQTDYTFTFRNADMTPVAGSATFSNGYGANVTNAYSYPASIEQCNTPGVDEDGDGKLDPADEDCIGFMTTAGIPVGFYVLEVLDITSNCPVFKSVEIKQDALSPVISLVGTTKANTSCDTSTPDGELIVSVNSDPNDPVLTNFNIDVLSLPGPTSAATYPRNNVVAGNYTASGLAPKTYTVTALGVSTGCTTQQDFTIQDIPVVSELVAGNIVLVDAEYCDATLEASAKIEVTNVRLVNGGAADLLADYDFEWYTDATLTSQVGGLLPVLQNGVNGLAANSGVVTFGDYFVVSKKARNAGGSGGIGCFSAPFQAIIEDKTAAPSVILHPFMDTSCELLGNFEGSLEVEVITSTLGLPGPDYTNPGTIRDFDYSWFNGGLAASTTNDGDRSNDAGTDQDQIPSLGPNTYGILVTSAATGCTATYSTTITKAEVPLVLADANVVDQILCGPDGSITVGNGDILVDGVPDNVSTNFEFSWFKDDPTSAPITVAVGNNIFDITDDASIGAGTYYVQVRKRSGAAFAPGSNCKSAPVRKDILDKHVNPTATLVPSNDTSCETNVPGFYEGSLVLTVVTPGSGPAPATYTLDWSSLTDDTTPADGTVAAGAFPVTVLNRRDDDYSVQVLNDASQCFVNVSTTITKLSVPVIVAAVNPVDQLLCSPDGSVTVTQVDVGGTVFVPADAAWTTDFEFAWYRNNPTTAQLQDGQAVPVDINRDQLEFGLNTAGQYPTMGAGTYYVTAKRTSGSPGFGCISAPVRSDVLDKHVNPTVQLTPADDTSCFTNPLDPFEGSIQLIVTSPGSGPAPANYTQAWSSLTNHTNPPNGAAYLAGPMTFNDLRDDTYTVRVTNNTSACFVDVSTVITKLDVPIIVANVTQQDQLLCLPDGELRVVQISVDASAINNASPAWSDFEFHWFKDDPTTARLTDGQAVPVVINGELLEDGTNPGQYPTLGAGEYYVQVKRIGGSPGNGCISAPIRKDILDKHINPTIVLTPANDTSCETVGNFEGSLRVQVTNPGSVASALFDYAWDATNPTPAADRLNVNNDQTFTGLIGDDTNDYAVTVTNDVTGCSITASARIQKVTVPIIIANASTGDQVICNPSGFISVDRIDVGTFSYTSADAEFANFEYAWYKDDPTSAVLVPVVAGNNLLDNIDLPTTMGAGTYYVTARRFSGSPGSGCISAPLRKDIFDVSVDPDVDFSSTPNSACIGGASNGEVIALAEERDGTTDVYTFAWSLLPGVLDPATITNASPTSTVADAADGRYTLVVTNTVTGCTFTKDLNLVLDQSLSLPNIVEVSAIDPLNCFPTGSAQVVEITIGGTASITDPVQLDADFDFEWYKNAFPTNLLAGEINANLPNQLPDNYFVLVRDLLTNCESLPVEVVISDEDIVYPAVEIRQSLPAIACDPTIGTAELISTADGNDDTNANYTFHWFPSLDTTGVSFAATSTISNLRAGNYSVRVLNTVTNCRAAAPFIIPDAAPQFLPLLAISTSERTRCDAEDGALSASGVPFPVDPTQVLNNYPFPYNYTAELYRGDPPADINSPEFGFMLNDPNFPTFTSNFLQANLPDGSYTVRLTDLNTGCVTIDAAVVEDGRVLPVITIVEDVPLTNCDVTRPNGQLSATADGGKIAGYAFNWFAGNTTTGTSLSTINKLIAQTAGDYTVLVRNNITGCEQNALGTITDGTVLPPVPNASLVRGRTNCDFPNGWVTVDVDGETLGYEFNWYDDPTNTGGTSDFEGIDYLDRDVGDYGATAKDLVTGCISPVGIVLVPDLRIIPMVNLTSTPSYCLTPTGSVMLELISDSVVLTTINWIDTVSRVEIGIGSALYDLPAGFYRADFETSEGCENFKTVEVKTEILSYNLVSANSDNSNDFWNIDCIQNFPNNNVKVFNRSGVKVYEADGYNNVDVFFRGVGEKGLYAMGNELPDGTYFYIIDKRDGSKPVVGYLELVH